VYIGTTTSIRATTCSPSVALRIRHSVCGC
jgi:hypothetical protein